MHCFGTGADANPLQCIGAKGGNSLELISATWHKQACKQAAGGLLLHEALGAVLLGGISLALTLVMSAAAKPRAQRRSPISRWPASRPAAGRGRRNIFAARPPVPPSSEHAGRSFRGDPRGRRRCRAATPTGELGELLNCSGDRARVRMRVPIGAWLEADLRGTLTNRKAAIRFLETLTNRKAAVSFLAPWGPDTYFVTSCP